VAVGDKFIEAALDAVLAPNEAPAEPPTTSSLAEPYRTPAPQPSDELLQLRVAVDELRAQCDAFGQKAHQLAEHLRAEIAARYELAGKLAVVNAGREDVWFWQGDGHDEIETLSRPVVMSAATLRALLAPKGHAEPARLDPDGTATGKTILSAERSSGPRDGGTLDPAPVATFYVDLETGVRTPLKGQ
jgi:hypothetical protein